MVLLNIFFTRIRSTGGCGRLFFIRFIAPCACSSSAVKILLQIFLYEDLACIQPYIHLSVVFPSRMPAGPHFVTQLLLLSENIPNIWHKSSTKHKEVRQIETIKTIMQTTPSYHMEGGFNGSGCHFFKEIFDQVRKDLDCELFYSELKRHNVSIIFTI